MSRRWIIASMMALAWAHGAPAADPPGSPHRDLTRQRVEYAGPGREDAAPADLNEILLGYFGPSDPAHAEGGDLWLAAGLAVEEANHSGGLHGLPFRLLPAWSENSWGTGVADVARLVYRDRVWAIIGSIDGASTHLAEQVVAKARLTLISPASTDSTVNLANVPWMFSCLPGDNRQAEVLSRALLQSVGAQPFTLISATDHDSRQSVRRLTRSLAERGIVARYHFQFEPGTGDLGELAAEVTRTDPRAVALIAGPMDSARLLVELRAHREDLAIFGGPSMGRRVFLEHAGAAAEGARFPLLCDPSASSSEFDRTFLARFGHRADCVAGQTYDATRLIIEAIRTAGLNRARIRDAVSARPRWSGVSGDIEWNLLGQNIRPVRLAMIREGQVVPMENPTQAPRRRTEPQNSSELSP